MNKTVTVVAAFRDAVQSHLRSLVAVERGPVHVDNVAALAVWAGEWLGGSEDHAGLGFTVSPSFGGGAGWDVEAGCTFTFAGVPAERVLAVVRFARALRVREEQQAVVVLVRDEGFSLIEA
jgi:hypothetical protein